MKRIIVQIYEVQEPREAEAVAALGADHVGSVILSPDPWRAPVVRDTVRAIQGAGAKSGVIPLFRDRETLFRVLDYYRPDFIHFCEALSPHPGSEAAVTALCDRLAALQRAIKEKFPAVAIMRSLSLPRQGNAEEAALLKNSLTIMARLAAVSDYFLIDTLLGSHHAGQGEPVAGFVGITGETCSWGMAARIVGESPIPVILAGGIGEDNVYESILQVRPAGVDSCTRTNARGADGRPVRFRKDLESVRRLVEETRRAETDLAAGAMRA